MPFQPAPGTAQVVVHGHTYGDFPMLNVFHVGIGTATLTESNTTAIMEAIAAPYYAHLRAATASTCGYDFTVLTDLRTEGASEWTLEPDNWPFVGTSSGQALPNQTAGIVNWQTALRGRSFRGRTFLGGFSEEFSAGRDIATDLHTAMVAWADDLLDLGYLGVLSRRHDGAERDEAVLNLITGHTVPTHWRTLRNRLHD